VHEILLNSIKLSNRVIYLDVHDVKSGPGPSTGLCWLCDPSLQRVSVAHLTSEGIIVLCQVGQNQSISQS
jgi:hypothetical protein